MPIDVNGGAYFCDLAARPAVAGSRAIAMRNANSSSIVSTIQPSVEMYENIAPAQNATLKPMITATSTANASSYN